MNNIQIDLDKRISEYVNKNTIEKIDINKYINDIVINALNLNNIVVNTIYISIQSASRDEIRKLNFEYRNIDRATDVLSFPIFDRNEIENLKKIEENKKFRELELGDIILCLDIIKEQSIEYKTGLLREILYMITHGVCHLLGYDHIEEEDKKKMRMIEEEILSDLGVFKSDEKK